MRRPVPSEVWPEAWKRSYSYDLVEFWARSAADLQEVAAWGYMHSYRLGYVTAYRNRLTQAIAALRRVAPPGARVLDVGAGPGNFSLLLAENGYEVTWNDLREELAGYVALKEKQTGSLHYAPGNIFELSLENHFDVVLITEIIEHVAHPDEFLARIAALVKPGGYVVMTTPNGDYWNNRLPKFSDCQDPSAFEQRQFDPDADGHIFLLHCSEVQELAQRAGLRVRELRVFNNTLTKGWSKTEPLLHILPARVVRTLERVTASGRTLFHRRINTHLLAMLQRPMDASDGRCTL
jgi:2-polyprenyl-3-methyl-5-hydroxy-6-metoxy-1,4-benzoquinol methylase